MIDYVTRSVETQMIMILKTLYACYPVLLRDTVNPDRVKVWVVNQWESLGCPRPAFFRKHFQEILDRVRANNPEDWTLDMVKVEMQKAGWNIISENGSIEVGY